MVPVFMPVFMVFEFQKRRKNRFSRFSGFLTDCILSPVDSAYSTYFSWRFWWWFDFWKYVKPIFLGFPVICRFLFYHHWNQHTQFAFPGGFCRLLIMKGIKKRFFSDFRFFVGLDFITIEISVVFYSYWPVFMSFECS